MSVKVQKSESLTTAERAAVEKFDDAAIRVGNSTSLIWKVALDSEGRRRLQLRKDPGGVTCLLEMTEDELQKLDEIRFKNILVNGDRPCTVSNAT